MVLPEKVGGWEPESASLEAQPLVRASSLAPVALYAIDATFAVDFCSRLECECDLFNLAS